jgi:hypothetical protein
MVDNIKTHLKERVFDLLSGLKWFKINIGYI